MTAACQGLRVVEIGQGMASELAGLVLADYGGDVVKVEPPAARAWTRQLPGFRMWNRGKRSVTLDLSVPADRDAALDLLSSCDVVIVGARPGVVERHGLCYDEVKRRNPRAVYCSISNFGPDHPLSRHKSYEYSVAGVIGRYVGLDRLSGALKHPPRDHPVFSAAPVASYGASQLAVQGILAALLVRNRSGLGQHVTTSLIAGEAAFLMRQEMARDDKPGKIVKPPAAQHAGVMLTFLTPRCADGRYLQMCARQDAHFRAWMRALDLEHIFDDPRYAKAPMGITSVEAVDELEQEVRARMALKTSDEWIRIFTDEFDVGGDPFLTADEFLAHPQLTANDRVLDVTDPEAGPVRMLGPLVLMSDTPGGHAQPAPRHDEHGASLPAIAADWRAKAAAVQQAPAGTDGAPPLTGITVVELGYYVAVPLATTLLAELGARVVKVEPLGFGDPSRRLGRQSAKFFPGKESLAINLKSPRAQELLRAVLADADCVVTNFRPGVPERLGFGWETLRQINPRLIYLHGGSYGSKGPQSHRSAFHSTPTALTGAGVVQAGEGNEPVDDSFPDCGSGLAAATAMMLGLIAREHTGHGQYLETSMLVSGGYVVSNDLVRYPGAPARPMVDYGQHGYDAVHRLYETGAGWVFVEIMTDPEWQRFATALGRPDWTQDPRFSSAAARLAHDADLIAEIDAKLRTRSAADWAGLLRAEDVSVVVVSEEPLESWFAEQGVFLQQDHADFGPYWQPPLKWSFSLNRLRVGSAPRLGEHTAEILRATGASDDEVDELVARHVVQTSPVLPAR